MILVIVPSEPHSSPRLVSDLCRPKHGLAKICYTFRHCSSVLKGEICFHDKCGLAAVLTHPGMPQGRWCVPRCHCCSLAPHSSESCVSLAVRQPKVEWHRKDINRVEILTPSSNHTWTRLRQLGDGHYRGRVIYRQVVMCL